MSICRYSLNIPNFFVKSYCWHKKNLSGIDNCYIIWLYPNYRFHTGNTEFIPGNIFIASSDSCICKGKVFTNSEDINLAPKHFLRAMFLRLFCPSSNHISFLWLLYPTDCSRTLIICHQHNLHPLPWEYSEAPN